MGPRPHVPFAYPLLRLDCSLSGSANIALTMARSKSFGRDRGLQTRMLLTLFLLGLVYAVLIGVLIAAGAGAVAVAVIAAVLFLVQYFTSDKIALYSMGAHEVTPAGGAASSTRRRAAVHSGQPAQAAGGHRRDGDAQRVRDRALAEDGHRVRHHRASSTCSTPAELEGVLGHELTHVAEPRRAGDDDRQLLRLDRLVHRPDRLLVRRRVRRRRRRQRTELASS